MSYTERQQKILNSTSLIEDYLRKHVLPEFKDHPVESIICALHVVASQERIKRGVPGLASKMSAICTDIKTFSDLSPGVIDAINAGLVQVSGLKIVKAKP